MTITITSNNPVEVITFARALSGTTLSLTGGSTNFDFGIGDQPAFVNLTLTRQ